MKIINKYFPDLSEKQTQKFFLLKKLYTDWNQKINLISRKDIEHLYLKHVLHSLSIAKIIEFNNGSSVLDVGTGGGFPGIPLAIYFENVNFFLIDSIGKKIKVVNDVIQKLNLNNVKAQQIRSEQLKQRFDFVVSRAVTNIPKFISIVQHTIKKKDKNSLPNGVIYLKGGNVDEEVSIYKKNISIYNISDYFEEEFFETKKILYLPL